MEGYMERKSNSHWKRILEIQMTAKIDLSQGIL